MKKELPVWLKGICVVLLLYSFVAGLWIPVPALPILNETIRNLFYHVPIWFALIFMAFLAMVHAVKYLLGKDMSDFENVVAANGMVVFFSVPGLLTGMIWARFTWGTWWTFQEPKLNGVAISLLIYAGFFLISSGISDRRQKAATGAAYNIFAFITLILFMLVLPRMTSSLHPGNGGNPAFGSYDLDNRMRLVFYPAVAGWIILSYWLFDLWKKFLWIKKHCNEKEISY